MKIIELCLRAAFGVVVMGAMASCGGTSSKTEPGTATAPAVDSLGEVKHTPPRDTIPATSIKWVDSTFKDLGVIKLKDSALVSFPFKNTGDQPLIVQSVKTSCGCTVADTLFKPVMPGKESKIQLKFYSEAQAVAIHEKHVYVITNTRPYGGTTLTFKVEVVD